MKKFDEHSTCPKCGYDPTTTAQGPFFFGPIRTRWIPDGTVMKEGQHEDEVGGILVRRCTRCTHEWRELSLDAAGDAREHVSQDDAVSRYAVSAALTALEQAIAAIPDHEYQRKVWVEIHRFIEAHMDVLRINPCAGCALNGVGPCLPPEEGPCPNAQYKGR